MSRITTSTACSCELAHQLVGVLALGDDVEALGGQQPREPVAQQDAVLGDALRARHLRPHPGAAAARGPDPQPSAERLDPVGEAAQAGAPLAVGAADAVVDDLDDHSARPRAVTSMVARLAWACLPMLARLSVTT